ncbi:hypothetical protein [Paraeggerthella hongkongensis]|uniref:hypothetical protein n=1 Tax=Paraeggerthella hongkongensis TaxID=230658 RepID=UPI0011CDDE4A|nr:hypothetical protein [Paraeggerthella hongkongensis]
MLAAGRAFVRGFCGALRRAAWRSTARPKPIRFGKVLNAVFFLARRLKLAIIFLLRYCAGGDGLRGILEPHRCACPFDFFTFYTSASEYNREISNIGAKIA